MMDGYQKAKGNYRKNSEHYTQFLHISTKKQIVEKYFVKEIELFNYRFGSDAM
ncbi:hypothetical protein GCM10020331_052870 [Ectobacillus funiculus]